MTANTKSHGDIPSNVDFIPYLLLALHNKGGRASTKSATAEVIRLMNIDKEIAERKRPPGVKIVSFRIRWARQMLADTGYLDKDAPRGVWVLTSQAMDRVHELDTNESREQFIKDTEREYQILLGKKGKRAVRDGRIPPTAAMHPRAVASPAHNTQQHESSMAIPLPPESIEEKMTREDLEIVQNMSLRTFKELCIKLLDATHHEDVRFSGGGDTFSGHGYLPDGHHYIKVVFEARWCTGAIERPLVNRLADSMKRMRASNGIFITNAEFSPDAHDAAASHGIKLIDCKKIVGLIHEHDIDGSSRSVKYLNRESFDES